MNCSRCFNPINILIECNLCAEQFCSNECFLYHNQEYHQSHYEQSQIENSTNNNSFLNYARLSNLQSPFLVTGVMNYDYITYDPKTYSINVWDAKYSSTGTYPNSVKGFGSDKWMKDVLEAIHEIEDPQLRQLAMDAYINERIEWLIFRWP